MGLFDFIKKLISGAKDIEAQAESFVAEVKDKSADLGNKLEDGVKKAKAVTKEVEETVEKVAKKAPAKKAPAKKAAKKATKPKAKRKPNPALMKPVQPDAVLGAVVGTKPAPRGQITKKLWDYIKKNKLQDELQKRVINADAKLKEIFGKAKADMFEMTKLINSHLK